MNIDNCLLAKIEVARPQFSGTDGEVTAAAQSTFRMTKGTGRYIKTRIPVSYFRPWVNVFAVFKARFYRLSGRFDDEGYRVIKAPEYSNLRDEWDAEIVPAANEFVANFRREYDDLVANAKVDLADAFRAGEFPPVDEAVKGFRFSFDAVPFPSDGASFLARLTKEQREATERSFKRRAARAQADVLRSFADVVSDFAARFKDGDTLRNSKEAPLENLREFVAKMDAGSFDLFDAGDLDHVARDCKELLELAGPSMRGLKGEDEEKRKEVGRRAAGLVKKAEGIALGGIE